MRRGPLPRREAVRILRAILSGLAAAHARGIVHGDVKPENVLLEGHHVVLADFGVARALEQATLGESRDRLTGTGLGLGTPGYMAPEQLAGERDVDARADLYALGVIAYEMLAGQQPFVGSTAQRVVAAHLTEAPRPLSEARPDVPPGTEDRAPRRDRDHRRRP
jgi:serine/threonine-protein kinase